MSFEDHVYLYGIHKSTAERDKHDSYFYWTAIFVIMPCSNTIEQSVPDKTVSLLTETNKINQIQRDLHWH